MNCVKTGSGIEASDSEVTGAENDKEKKKKTPLRMEWMWLTPG